MNRFGYKKQVTFFFFSWSSSLLYQPSLPKNDKKLHINVKSMWGIIENKQLVLLQPINFLSHCWRVNVAGNGWVVKAQSISFQLLRLICTPYSPVNQFCIFCVMIFLPSHFVEVPQWRWRRGFTSRSCCLYKWQCFLFFVQVTTIYKII